MTTWPEHFIVYCIGKGDGNGHPPVEVFRRGVDLERELIDIPHPIAYVVGLSTDEEVNKTRLRLTGDAWECPTCGLSVRMSHAGDLYRNLVVDLIEAGQLRVTLAEWIRLYDSPVARNRYPGRLVDRP